MDILLALGVNQTIGIQLAVFLVVYVILTRLVFQPYYQAFLKRSERTVGNTENAEQLLTESKALELRYQDEARALNADLKKIYDAARLEAVREFDKVTAVARERAKGIIEDTRVKTATELQKAQPDAKNEAKAISTAIVNKMLGKEVAV